MHYAENGEAAFVFTCSKEKPNVFLIGDSIREGYCQTVKELLQGKAEVFYTDGNSRSSQYIIFNIKKWAALFDDPHQVDMIHFNCGQWDVAHWSGHALPLTSETEYAKNLQIIADLLRQYFPRAILIFATTSPMNPDGSNGLNPRSNADVNRYNGIAKEVMAQNKIVVNDINALMRDWGSECYIDSCHLTQSAFARLGEYVAKVLEMYLGNQT